MTEAELLFTEILDCDRIFLYLNRDLNLDKNSFSIILSVLKRRFLGEPVEYILGKTEFMGLEFKVNQDVFIPRPETEALVETVVKYASSAARHTPCVDILDLGTGSGCIAISLARFICNAKITALDCSARAIDIAKYNAALNNVTDKIRFINSDLFAAYELQSKNYDIIASNPPYISAAEIETLQPEINYEPRIALDGGTDGLDFYRNIAAHSPFHLKEDGFLIMEIGFAQADKLSEIIKDSGIFKIIDIVKDYNAIERVMVAQKHLIKNG